MGLKDNLNGNSKDNSRKLPILISVPHGGTYIPEELRGRCTLSEVEILLDGDTWSRELFNFKGLVEDFVDTEVARIVVDMNRDPEDLPPNNPDGVVKTVSVDQKTVWDSPTGLSSKEIQNLLKTYHTPYHQRLKEASSNADLVMAIDCHTMLDIGPKKNTSKWTKRPMFCISNRGDENGSPIDELITAPPELMLKMRNSIEKHFLDFYPVLGDQDLVAINTPFRGGYITQHHGTQSSIPWIQLEINRALYLPSLVCGHLDGETKERMLEVRDRLFKVFEECIFRGKL